MKTSQSSVVRRASRGTALVLLSVLLAACATAAPAATAAPTAAPAATPAPVVSSSAGTRALASFEASLEGIYASVEPSVVNIRVEKPATTAAIPGFGALPFSVPQAPQVSEAIGSGFVWDTQGHVVTNNHVIDGATSIQVTFSDGISASATVVGADPDSDLAVLKVDQTSEALHPVTMAQPGDVTVGQVAIAIGTPYGLEDSMTMGIVSAVGRSLPTDNGTSAGVTYSIPAVIQTDAPLNPGNSGGVLVNIEGQVIGVTSAIVSPVDASAGIGFAIPSAIVDKVIPALIENGHYDHPYLGISGMSLNNQLAHVMGLPADQTGVLVVEVTPGSPADHAGLRGSTRSATIEGTSTPIGGDVITAIGGQPLRTFGDLAEYLALQSEVGQTIRLDVIRNGRPTQLDVALTARPSSGAQQAKAQSTEPAVYLGIGGIGLDARLAQAAGLPEKQQGVLVESVEAGSPADQAGLRGGTRPVFVNGQVILVGGDVITTFNQQPVASMEDLQALLGQTSSGQQARLTILRDGNTLEVTVTLVGR